jgi:hypothetical protein
MNTGITTFSYRRRWLCGLPEVLIARPRGWAGRGGPPLPGGELQQSLAAVVASRDGTTAGRHRSSPGQQRSRSTVVASRDRTTATRHCCSHHPRALPALPAGARVRCLPAPACAACAACRRPRALPALPAGARVRCLRCLPVPACAACAACRCPRALPALPAGARVRCLRCLPVPACAACARPARATRVILYRQSGLAAVSNPSPAAYRNPGTELKTPVLTLLRDVNIRIHPVDGIEGAVPEPSSVTPGPAVLAVGALPALRARQVPGAAR